MIDSTKREEIVGKHQTETIVVSYEDMANPRRVGTIVEASSAGEYRVAWDDEDGGETWSDLRQAGWQLVSMSCPRCGFSGAGGKCASWCPRTPSEARAEKSAELAEYAVLFEYDRTRSRLGHDYGSGQRASELSRRRREGRFDVDAELDPAEHVTPAAFAAAFERVGLPKVRRAESETFRRETPATSRTLRAWRMVGMLAEQKRQSAERPVHLQTASSEVRCGARMGEEWDLGNVTTEARLVTCPACRPAPISGTIRRGDGGSAIRRAIERSTEPPADHFFYALPPSSTEDVLDAIERRGA